MNNDSILFLQSLLTLRVVLCFCIFAWILKIKREFSILHLFMEACVDVVGRSFLFFSHKIIRGLSVMMFWMMHDDLIKEHFVVCTLCHRCTRGVHEIIIRWRSDEVFGNRWTHGG